MSLIIKIFKLKVLLSFEGESHLQSIPPNKTKTRETIATYKGKVLVIHSVTVPLLSLLRVLMVWLSEYICCPMTYK